MTSGNDPKAIFPKGVYLRRLHVQTDFHVNPY